MHSAGVDARSPVGAKCRKTLEERLLSCYIFSIPRWIEIHKTTERSIRQQRKNNRMTKGCKPVMVRVQKSPMTAARMIRPLLVVVAIFYLSYHALHGERGLYALFREQHERTQLQEHLAKTKAKRESMELRVSHLRDGSLDLDLLDEQMRRMLGVMKPGEVVVMQGN